MSPFKRVGERACACACELGHALRVCVCVCVLLFAKEPLYPLFFLFLFLVLLEFIGTAATAAAAVEDCCHQAERGSAPHSTSLPHPVPIFTILRALKKNLAAAAAAAADDHVRSEEEEEEEEKEERIFLAKCKSSFQYGRRRPHCVAHCVCPFRLIFLKCNFQSAGAEVERGITS